MSVDITQESVFDALHKVPRGNRNQVLEFLHHVEPPSGLPSEAAEPKHWTATAVLAIPRVAGWQVKSVSENRFETYLGHAKAQKVDAIAATVALVVGKPQAGSVIQRDASEERFADDAHGARIVIG